MYNLEKKNHTVHHEFIYLSVTFAHQTQAAGLTLFSSRMIGQIFPNTMVLNR